MNLKKRNYASTDDHQKAVCAINAMMQHAMGARRELIRGVFALPLIIIAGPAGSGKRNLARWLIRAGLKTNDVTGLGPQMLTGRGLLNELNRCAAVGAPYLLCENVGRMTDEQRRLLCRFVTDLSWSCRGVSDRGVLCFKPCTAIVMTVTPDFVLNADLMRRAIVIEMAAAADAVTITEGDAMPSVDHATLQLGANDPVPVKVVGGMQYGKSLLASMSHDFLSGALGKPYKFRRPGEHDLDEWHRSLMSEGETVCLPELIHFCGCLLREIRSLRRCVY